MPSDLKAALDFVPLVLRLGLAVYEAVQRGDTSKTVGEIFHGVPLDAAEIDRLDAAAAAEYARRGASSRSGLPRTRPRSTT